jgi:hypothetical protein
MGPIKRLLRRFRRPVDPERVLARAQAQARRRAAPEAHGHTPGMPQGWPAGGGDL